MRWYWKTNRHRHHRPYSGPISGPQIDRNGVQYIFSGDLLFLFPGSIYIVGHEIHSNSEPILQVFSTDRTDSTHRAKEESCIFRLLSDCADEVISGSKGFTPTSRVESHRY